MREIKFRAWITVDVNDIDEDIKAMTYDLAFTKYAPINELLNKQDDLMQFTGLKDKNGKDIYEGDIVSFITEKTCYDGLPLKTKRIGKVFWMEFRSVFAIQINAFMNQDLYKFIQYGNTVEVIGNIYENPEM